MRELKRRLVHARYHRKLIDEYILPEWWDDQIALTPAGFAEGASIISRYLGISMVSLLDPDTEISPRELSDFKFKSRRGLKEANFIEARAVITQAARLIADAMSNRFISNTDLSAAAVRRQILDNGSASVNLESLLEYCWSVYLPIIFISVDFTPEKPDGAAVKVADRPIIFITNNHRFPSWLLFDIAHELGHIALGHTDPNSILFDGEITSESSEADEIAVSRYATELLTGYIDFNASSFPWPETRLMIRRKAVELGKKYHIDPGHLLLNLADKERSYYPLVTIILDELTPEADARDIIRVKMKEYIPWECLSDESGDFIRRITGM